METRERIEVNFAKTIQLAERLEEIARKMNGFVEGAYTESICNVKAVWQSEQADLFCKKGIQLHEKIFLSAEELFKIAGGIKSAAQNIYEAELAALLVAQMRGYM